MSGIAPRKKNNGKAPVNAEAERLTKILLAVRMERAMLMRGIGMAIDGFKSIGEVLEELRHVAPETVTECCDANLDIIDALQAVVDDIHRAMALECSGDHDAD